MKCLDSYIDSLKALKRVLRNIKENTPPNNISEYTELIESQLNLIKSQLEMIKQVGEKK